MVFSNDFQELPLVAFQAQEINPFIFKMLSTTIRGNHHYRIETD
jgi:hypothetical protein